MRALPFDDPGTADHRSPGRFLWWLARGQWHTLALGMFFGVIWMSSQAVLPALIGRAIDRGVADRDSSALLMWTGLLFAVGLVQAASGIVRHRFAVTNWLTTAYRTVQLVTRQSVRLGGSLPRQVSTGEVVAIGTSDLSHLGQVMDVSARFAGAVVSFVLVAVILLQTSTTLGLVVLLGVPTLVLLIGPLLAPLQRRSTHQRHLMGELSNTATDIVSGLRVLRGIGGEQVFHARYARESQATRRAGVQVARLQSLLDALQVLLPGVFVVVVVWLGARYAVAGRISPGELVAFYGYAAFLMIPLRTATEYANKLIRGLVSARRGRPRPLPRRAPTWSTSARGCGCPPGAWWRWSASNRTSRPRSPTGSGSATPTTTPAYAWAGCRWWRCRARRYAAASSSRTPARCCSRAGWASASTCPATATSSAPVTASFTSTRSTRLPHPRSNRAAAT